MSIRATFIIVFSALFLPLAGLVYVSYQSTESRQRATDAEIRRFESWQLADELRQSSDELTRMARTFVVTGDPIFESHFNDILAIRNGEMPRPENYAGIYWDFIVAARSRAESTGAAVSLQDLMQRMGFTDEEFAKLAEAQLRSDALVGLEEVAMNAAKGRFADASGEFTVIEEPDFDLARRIMHGEEYHLAKADIMQPISEFFRLMDERTARDVDAARAAAARDARIVIILAVVAAGFVVLSFLLLLALAIAPIKQMVGRLRDVAEGEGDLTQRVDESRRNEVGELGRWFNTFVQVVHDIVRGVAGTSNSVAAAGTEIAATARQQESTVSELSASTRQIAVAVNEIAAAGTELTATMGAVSEVACETSSLAEAGQAGLREMDATIQGLTDSNGSIATKLTSLEEKAAAVKRIVTTIVKVADQTNLLSVNAAIEADKAGSHGAGFHVVAREMRHLADQTAVATLEIEHDVRVMQLAMSEGMTEMDRFRANVDQVVDRVSQVGDQLAQIIDKVQRLSGQFQSVNEGMAQQSAGILHINEAMSSLNESASQTTESLGEFVRTAEQLKEVTTQLTSQIARFKIAGAN